MFLVKILAHKELIQISLGAHNRHTVRIYIAVMGKIDFDITILRWIVSYAIVFLFNSSPPSAAYMRQYIDGLVQERHISSAFAMESCLSCINPSISSSVLELLDHVCLSIKYILVLLHSWYHCHFVSCKFRALEFFLYQDLASRL